MHTVIAILQPISAILLSLVILAQNRGSGLGSAFGGTGGGFYATKRGAEKVLGNLTIALVIIFLLLSFLSSVVE